MQFRADSLRPAWEDVQKSGFLTAFRQLFKLVRPIPLGIQIHRVSPMLLSASKSFIYDTGVCAL